jgi:hypothetical protein
VNGSDKVTCALSPKNLGDLKTINWSVGVGADSDEPKLSLHDDYCSAGSACGRAYHSRLHHSTCCVREMS